MIATMHFTRLSTPIGEIQLVGDGDALHRLDLPGRLGPVGDAMEDAAAFAEPLDQLERYFRGELHAFELELEPRGGEFDLAVWERLRAIPYGRTISYGELAESIGHPTAFRAVGAANGRNPLPIVVPCHRVIGSDGSLTGFGGGLDAKRALLELEAGGIQGQLL